MPGGERVAPRLLNAVSKLKDSIPKELQEGVTDLTV